MVDALEVGVAQSLIHVPGGVGGDREQRGRRTARAHAAEGDVPAGRKATGIEDELVGVVEPADGQRGCPADALSSDRKVLDRPVQALAPPKRSCDAPNTRPCAKDALKTS